jgi:hypothetical protein
LYGDRLESALIDCAASSTVSGASPLHGVAGAESVHERRKRIIGLRPHDEVPVIGHDAVREDLNREMALRLDQYLEVRFVVLLMLEERDSLDRTVEDMKDQAAGELPRTSGHWASSCLLSTRNDRAEKAQRGLPNSEPFLSVAGS